MSLEELQTAMDSYVPPKKIKGPLRTRTSDKGGSIDPRTVSYGSPTIPEHWDYKPSRDGIMYDKKHENPFAGRLGFETTLGPVKEEHFRDDGTVDESFKQDVNDFQSGHYTPAPGDTKDGSDMNDMQEKEVVVVDKIDNWRYREVTRPVESKKGAVISLSKDLKERVMRRIQVENTDDIFLWADRDNTINEAEFRDLARMVEEYENAGFRSDEIQDLVLNQKLENSNSGKFQMLYSGEADPSRKIERGTLSFSDDKDQKEGKSLRNKYGNRNLPFAKDADRNPMLSGSSRRISEEKKVRVFENKYWSSEAERLDLILKAKKEKTRIAERVKCLEVLSLYCFEDKNGRSLLDRVMAGINTNSSWFVEIITSNAFSSKEAMGYSKEIREAQSEIDKLCKVLDKIQNLEGEIDPDQTIPGLSVYSKDRVVSDRRKDNTLRLIEHKHRRSERKLAKKIRNDIMWSVFDGDAGKEVVYTSILDEYMADEMMEEVPHPTMTKEEAEYYEGLEEQENQRFQYIFEDQSLELDDHFNLGGSVQEYVDGFSRCDNYWNYDDYDYWGEEYWEDDRDEGCHDYKDYDAYEYWDDGDHDSMKTSSQYSGETMPNWKQAYGEDESKSPFSYRINERVNTTKRKDKRVSIPVRRARKLAELNTFDGNNGRDSVYLAEEKEASMEHPTMTETEAVYYEKLAEKEARDFYRKEEEKDKKRENEEYYIRKLFEDGGTMDDYVDDYEVDSFYALQECQYQKKVDECQNPHDGKMEERLLQRRAIQNFMDNVMENPLTR